MRPELRFIFIPHNASSDADTRAQMSIMMLEDLLTFANSHKPEDLRKIHLIPELRNLITEKNLKKSKKNGNHIVFGIGGMILNEIVSVSNFLLF